MCKQAEYTLPYKDESINPKLILFFPDLGILLSHATVCIGKTGLLATWVIKTLTVPRVHYIHPQTVTVHCQETIVHCTDSQAGKPNP